MKTEKPKVRKRILYLENELSIANENFENEKLNEDRSGFLAEYKAEVKLFTKLIKLEYEILYFENDIITFDELEKLFPDQYWLYYYPIEFSYKGVDYHTTYICHDMIGFKKSGRGNNKEIIIYKR